MDRNPPPHSRPSRVIFFPYLNGTSIWKAGKLEQADLFSPYKRPNCIFLQKADVPICIFLRCTQTLTPPPTPPFPYRLSFAFLQHHQVPPYLRLTIPHEGS